MMRRLLVPLIVVAGEQLRVGVVSWNLATRSPLARDCRFLKQFADCDLVVVGCQEVETLKPRRNEGRRSARLLELIGKVLKGFRIVRHVSGGVQLFVLTRTSAKFRFADVACGVGNLLKNKGAVGCFVVVDKAKLLFITAHLAAHEPKVAERNADYHRIVGELAAASPWARRPLGHAVIFSGDLNYRLQGLTRAEVECAIEDGEMGDLFDGFDQLSREKGARRAFAGLHEGKVSFKPTFKFDRYTHHYDTSKKRRVPAWTDRVLFTPRPGLDLRKYDAAVEATHSDHRPVFALFDLDPNLLHSTDDCTPLKTPPQNHHHNHLPPPPHAPSFPRDDDDDDDDQ
ncbi:hypothetical protein CTAYLR_004971 [Chrysophaeum taylorii]|uniref:Inositol polyphosphate-related phosphatase domain-containing protein n=1 Tax=Chrysophaeum taylorii TaxID=2483200 RepID=A0AAD7URA5_9STRA|nr:hypothetical protein CTAYLR_004971 [Chrysophaeum taylorii]